MINDISGEQEKGSNSLQGYDHKRFSNDRRYIWLVREAAMYYDNMRSLHDKWRRDIDYYMGRQLNDTVEYNGMTMTVHDYMQLKGMPAISNDILSDKIFTMKGLMRQQYMTATIKSVDANESDYANIFNEFLRQNDNNNGKAEQSAELFEHHICLAFICEKVKWAFRKGREDVFLDMVDPFKIAVPTWEKKDLSDIEFIAEAHDVTWPQLLKQFYRQPSDEKKLQEIYSGAMQTRSIIGRNETGMYKKDTSDGFLYPDTEGKYRYIEIWNKEYNRALWVHDRMQASAGFRPLSDKAAIDAENERREQANIICDEDGMPRLDADGNYMYYIDPAELELIEYETQIEEIWYYRCLSPNGYLLDEGVSPYKVLRDGYSFYYHPYVFLSYGMLGEVRSFEDRLIDKQRQYNHDCILTDFIIMNSSKGAMAVDTESISDMQSLEEMTDQYVKVGGIVLYTSKKGGQAPATLMNHSMPAGLDLILERDRNLLTNQSGIQPALQGVHAANTTGTQYRIERDSSAASISDYISCFNTFLLQVAQKQIWTMQWYYTGQRSIQITGEDYRQYFNPDTMRDIDFDLALSLDANSAVIREQLKDLVYQAYQRDEIEFGQMIDLADFGDTSRLKRAWEDYKQRKQEAAAAQMQQQQAAVMPPVQPQQQQKPQSAEHLVQADGNSTGAVAGNGGISA